MYDFAKIRAKLQSNRDSVHQRRRPASPRQVAALLDVATSAAVLLEELTRRNVTGATTEDVPPAHYNDARTSWARGARLREALEKANVAG
jgi:hypothetical protein